MHRLHSNAVHPITGRLVVGATVASVFYCHALNNGKLITERVASYDPAVTPCPPMRSMITTPESTNWATFNRLPSSEAPPEEALFPSEEQRFMYSELLNTNEVKADALGAEPLSPPKTPRKRRSRKSEADAAAALHAGEGQQPLAAPKTPRQRRPRQSSKQGNDDDASAPAAKPRRSRQKKAAPPAAEEASSAPAEGPANSRCPSEGEASEAVPAAAADSAGDQVPAEAATAADLSRDVSA